MGCASSKQVIQEHHDETEDIRDSYAIGKILGSGSFGQVRDCVLRTSGEVRAVKIIEKDSSGGDWSSSAIFKKEVELLQKLDHSNIVRFFDFFEDQEFLYVVMEKCNGGELFQKILELRRFREADAASLCRQMLLALKYIHDQGIVHRDIKAENFIFKDVDIKASTIKLIDFGMATPIGPDEKLHDLCGSPHYLAPELIGQSYNKTVDLWSLGVLMYLMLYGRYPYDGSNPQDIMMQILTSKIKWFNEKYSPTGKALDFMQRLLDRNGRTRMSAQDALKADWLAAAEENKAEVPVEVVRKAVKKLTRTKRPVNEEVERRRAEKIKQIDEDFQKGIKKGKRLGKAVLVESKKPEFVRRANQTKTAPSNPKAIRLVEGTSEENHHDSLQVAVEEEGALLEHKEVEEEEEEGWASSRSLITRVDETQAAKLRKMYEDFVLKQHQQSSQKDE